MRIINKKALHNYHLLEHFEAGVVLTGAEVKSIRAGRLDMGEAYVRILGEEAFLVNANIPRYMQADVRGYDLFKSRKLLLHRKEINSLLGKTTGKGITLLPISVYEKDNKFKLEIGLGKSKKEFDKRKLLKEKDNLRRIQQELRGDKE